jgi:PERQ amino acid-rich with GYF domain-containing protein
MHFGPEWMRTKQAPSRTNPSPPLTASASAGAHSYSALVTPATQAPPDKRDPTHPFRYSKEDLIRIYKEGGGKGGLGLEVERWDGIVRELGADPISLKELGEAEKKVGASAPSAYTRTFLTCSRTHSFLRARSILRCAAVHRQTTFRSRRRGFLTVRS